jgi:hypothetical protein
MKPSGTGSFFEEKSKRKRMRRYLLDINGKVNTDSDPRSTNELNVLDRDCGSV